MSSTSDSDIDFIDRLRAPKPRKFRERVNYLETLDDVEILFKFYFYLDFE